MIINKTTHQAQFILKNCSFKTKLNQTIDFNFYEFKPSFDHSNPSSLAEIYNQARKHYVTEAIIEGEQVGYLHLSEIPINFFDNYFNTPTDWLLLRFGNQETISNWINGKNINDKEKQNIALLSLIDTFNLNKSHSFQINKKTIEDFIQHSHYLANYKSFISYWLNKPNTQLVRVYSEKDLLKNNFNTYPFLKTERLNCDNQKNKNIGKSLYKATAIFLSLYNKDIYSSKTQTKDGQLLWDSLVKDDFCVTETDIYLDSNTKNRKQNIERTRHKLTSPLNF